jgi:morphogenetic protein associated with SpoVID
MEYDHQLHIRVRHITIPVHEQVMHEQVVHEQVVHEQVVHEQVVHERVVHECDESHAESNTRIPVSRLTYTENSSSAYKSPRYCSLRSLVLLRLGFFC